VPASYLTTPIYYANDLPHIGHAYTTIAADVLARYQRARGRDVFLLTGTDEHGVNIERVAASRGLSPTDHVDQVADAFRQLWVALDIGYDRFIRTTEPAHQRAVQAFWSRLQSSGDLYRGTFAGAYCPRCEAYYQEDELVGRACPVHQLDCEIVTEENWFFRLSRYQDVLEHLVRDTDFVRPEARRNEVLSVVQAGLRDFSVSRRQVRWGVAVPDSPHEVIYVWVDALVNYLSGLGFPHDAATFERYWPAELHVVGKEIIRFHCVYWPALLLSARLPVPKHVFAHGWLTKDGKKISKTTGNIVDPSALIAEFGSDAVRYYFLRSVPFGQDGDFTRQSFVARYNADLANDFGNLVQRATTLASRHALLLADAPGNNQLCAPEIALQSEADALPGRIAVAFERLALHEAAAAIGTFVKQANRYLEATAPWLLARNGDSERLGVVLRHAIHAARLAAAEYEPFIPRAAQEAQLRLSASPPRIGAPLFPRVMAPSA
jgi:methionyl-tRNA synthetase